VYKEKLLNTNTTSNQAEQLRILLLEYHQFRHQEADEMLTSRKILSQWQCQRLQRTHHDLYHTEHFHDALVFLLEELYASTNFTQRDDDIDRIFPKIAKLLPENILYTLSQLIELNLLTQKLDDQLARMLFKTMQVTTITEENYIEAYRRCNNQDQRLHQVQLTANIGNDLDVFVKSKLLYFTLKLTRTPAEMAGLGQLHQFLNKGFDAFHNMGGVDQLLDKIVEREICILQQIYQSQSRPLQLPRRYYTMPTESTTPPFSDASCQDKL